LLSSVSQFQQDFHLTRRELRAQDTRQTQPAEFRIEPAEFFDMANALRQVWDPVVPGEVPLRLGPYTKLTICTAGAEVTFRWGGNPSGWEPLAFVVEKNP